MQARGVRTLLVLSVVFGTGLAVLAGCGGGSGSGGPVTFAPPARHQSSASTPDFPSSTATSTLASTPAGPAPTKEIALPTRQERIAALQAQTHERVVVVAVPGGYEAASYDQLGHLQFWQQPEESTTWTQTGQSSYPYVPALGPPHAQVRGAHLAGMQHATFIVYGVFTGDGSGNAVAFTTGANGWGAIKAEPSGNIGPSGEPVGPDLIGLSYNFGFAAGHLITEDCPTDRPISQCGKHPIVKRWSWTGSDFALS